MGNFVEGTVGKLVMSFLALILAVFFAKVASVVLFGIAGGIFWMALVVYFLIGWFALRASTYIVPRADGLIVFAQRRPVRAKNGKGWEEAVYTAYAPELDTAKMRTAGLDYLRHLQRVAYNHIKDNDVRSRVEPDTTVADRIPRDMVLRLMITEHVDPLHMKFVGIEQCIHEVLVIVAANQAR